MKFNIGTTEIPSQSTGSTRLAGGVIHTVTFDGVEAKTIDKKDGTASFDVVALKFKNENGAFEHVIFEPKAGDEVRQVNTFGTENPSNMEMLLFTIKHFLSAVAPTVAKQIEEKGLVVDGWNGKNGMREFLVNNTKKSIGATTQIKLMPGKPDPQGRPGAPVFPSFPLGMSKDGNPFPKTNFIGLNLKFTAKEIERINAVENATPTSMDSATPAAGSANDDLIF